jgi:diguanylate cyclase (GGDEF)-like protein
MGAPLKGEAGVIGVMAMKSYTEAIRFDQKDLNLLEFVSTQVAQAIERKRMEEEIRNLSLTDELTGLYNRRGFTLLAEHEVKLARREKRNMLLVFADVDGLKTINDMYGHAQGDLALQEVSALLKNSLREADIIARYGGDEFVALAVDAALESADILSKRIQKALEAHNQETDRPYGLALSTGMVCYDPETACTLSEMIAQADAQMYAQKQARKGKKELPDAEP